MHIGLFWNCVHVCVRGGRCGQTWRAYLLYEWAMSHIWMSHVSHMNESCLTYEWVMSHIWTSHVSHMNESCLTYEWVMSHICIHKWDMTYSCEWDMTYSCEWDMTHSWVRHDLFMCGTRLICGWDTWLIHVSETWLIHKWDITYSCEWDMTHS